MHVVDIAPRAVAEVALVAGELHRLGGGTAVGVAAGGFGSEREVFMGGEFEAAVVRNEAWGAEVVEVEVCALLGRAVGHYSGEEASAAIDVVLFPLPGVGAADDHVVDLAEHSRVEAADRVIALGLRAG